MGFQNVNKNKFHGFGNLLIRFWKTFGNMFRVVRAYPVFKFLKVKQFTGFFIVSVHPKL